MFRTRLTILIKLLLCLLRRCRRRAQPTLGQARSSIDRRWRGSANPNFNVLRRQRRNMCIFKVPEAIVAHGFTRPKLPHDG